mmetsp:Transcript_21279/g.54507  ORF Transcript_21279/g.54507 Transcript_21279/m.54507 type:complete len:92 (+) Transcript_21279:1352-1627(+)
MLRRQHNMKKAEANAKSIKNAAPVTLVQSPTRPSEPHTEPGDCPYPITSMSQALSAATKLAPATRGIHGKTCVMACLVTERVVEDTVDRRQ